MLGRLAAAAALMAVAACAGVEPVGRNAQQSAASAPAPAPRTVAPAPQTVAPTPAPAQTPAPVAQAPAAQTQPQATAPAPTPTPAPTPAATPTPTPTSDADVDDGSIVVPGQRDVQVQPPSGDPRSVAERMEDVRAWDQCVTQVQAAFERDPMRPQLDSPEEYCSRTLGMRDRTAVPASRRVRR